MYIYVNSRATKQAREAHRDEQRITETNEIHNFEPPKLKFDSGKQDPINGHGFLGHEPLACIGVYAFVANDHVHGLHDVATCLSAHAHYVEEDSSAHASSHHLSMIDEEAELAVSHEGDNQDEGSSSDDDMDITPEA